MTSTARTRRLKRNFEDAIFGVEWDTSAGMQALELDKMPQAIEALGSAMISLKVAVHCAGELTKSAAVSSRRQS